MIDKLFMICVSFLEFLGRTLSLTYKEISVIFNLYVQGFIITVTGVLPALFVVTDIKNIPSLSEILIIIYGILCVMAFVKILSHYRPPMNMAFERCVDDLLWMASKYKTTYNKLNIIIFVVIWLLIFAFNILLILITV